jgi:hypothetical protein
MALGDGDDVRPSREIARPSNFEKGWFSQAPAHSWPPPSAPPLPPTPIGRPGWSASLGAIAGGLGGPLMVIVAQGILSVRHSGVDLVRLLGHAAAHVFVDLPDARLVGLASAAAVGALLGAPLGFLTRRLLRIVPRLVFFTLLSSALWLFVRTLVIGKMMPGLAAQLPFVPLLVGSVVYAVCIAIVLPARVATN